MNATVRNVVIVLVLAALVAIVPGGGTVTDVIVQALSLAFLAALGWVAFVMYRQHHSSLDLLGDRRRAALYGAVAALAIVLTATSRMWQTSLGSVAWLVIVAGAIYVGFSVIWSARRY
ncbi:MAG: hypothetical protein ABSH51_32260 [Solirubrobacteraceae bacterium]|jgi:hypothetical protein